MPFNGSGVFERVYSWTADRDAGTKILADRVDTETNGIVAGLNAVVDGTQAFIGPVKPPNGTAAAPAFAFSGDTDSGLYRVSADILGFAVNGTLEARVEAGFLDAVNGLKIGGTAVTSTAAELNLLDGVTTTTAQLNDIATKTGTQTLTNKTFNFANNTVTVDGTNAAGFRAIPNVGAKTASYTLATGDVGKFVEIGSGGLITIPDATFSEGDAISLFNNTTEDITLTCSIATAYVSGTDSDKATVTLATRGVCTVLFISGTVCVISGSVS